MKTRVVHQTRLVLIACLIAFGLPGSSYAQGGSSYSKGLPTWATSVAYSPDGDAVATGHFDERVRLWDATPQHTYRAYVFGLGCGVFTGWAHVGQCYG